MHSEVHQFTPFLNDYKFKFNVSGQFKAVFLKIYVCLVKTINMALIITDYTIVEFNKYLNIHFYFLGFFRM